MKEIQQKFSRCAEDEEGRGDESEANRQEVRERDAGSFELSDNLMFSSLL